MRTRRSPGAPLGTAKLTLKYLEQLQPIKETTRTGRSARRADQRRRRQEEDDAVRRGRPTPKKNRREVQEARRSEQTGHALGRTWLSERFRCDLLVAAQQPHRAVQNLHQPRNTLTSGRSEDEEGHRLAGIYKQTVGYCYDWTLVTMAT
ncbi:hypothetical protein NDU88_006435 [Pleurodeles waltl]|uniref:Uncharacterized protein n=1 Tax=Pleurodeles waltl TaxID=8319 RepID=A0AAV7TWT7_PLEWA|nr:hypothetical protein NDU88_006435 [Pleurodeles waltl]